MQKFHHCLSTQICDTDTNNRMTTKGALRLLQETATLHSSLAKNGPNDMDNPEFCAWVLFQQKIHVYARPCWNTPLSIHTWSRGAKGFYCLRNSTACLDDGTPVAISSSSWLALSPKEMSIIRPGEHTMKNFGYCEEAVFPTPLKKLHPGETHDLRISYTIRHCDIDFNHHANNLVYLDIAGGCMPAGQTPEDFNTLEVMFKMAAMEGDCVLCDRSPYQNGYAFTLSRERDHHLLCVLHLWNEESGGI